MIKSSESLETVYIYIYIVTLNEIILFEYNRVTLFFRRI